MKLRAAFVSNSSAASFVLDKRNKRVQEILAQNKDVWEMCFDNRCTGIIEGQKAIDECQKQTDFEDWSGQAGIIMGELYGIAEKIGAENIVCLRESDEGSGGSIKGTNWKELEKLALFTTDWH